MKFPHWPIPLGAKPITLGLERVSRALELMGNPHLKLPKVIHVAGTNGKGSTVAFLRSILEANGNKCHVYTSPHLIEFNERIVIAGKEISDDFLIEVLNETKAVCETEMELSFFEGTTLAAILAFSKVEADYVLLETGLGGRLDATNIMGQDGTPNPALTIITPISLDHTEYLGDTVEQIAAEKAAIIKQNTPCIIGQQNMQIKQVIAREAKSKNAKTIGCDDDFAYRIDSDGGLSVSINNKIIKLPKPSLIGEHQYHNAAVAIAAALELNKNISIETLSHGVKNTVWKARMQKINDGKIIEILGKDNEIYLDGGHNEAASENIRNFIVEENKKSPKDNFAIIGMLKRKNVNNFILNLKDSFDEIIFCPIEGENDSHSSSDLLKTAKELAIKAQESTSIEDALIKVKKENSDDYRLVICGSLYLAGQVLEMNST